MNRQVERKFAAHLHGWQFALVVAILLSISLGLATASVVLAQGSYDYTVQEGESWDTVAQRTGVSVDALKAANPEAAERENGWLLVGETLAVPIPAAAPPRIHKVTAGESWHSIAAQYKIPVTLLIAANPHVIRDSNMLHRGDELIIPVPGAAIAQPVATSTATATVTATATMTEETDAESDAEAEATPVPTEEATEEADQEADQEADEAMTEPEMVTETVESTATVAIEETEAAEATETEATETEATDSEEAEVEATEAVTATESMTGTAEMDASESMTQSGGTESDSADSDAELDDEVMADLPECPERFTEYPQLMTELINSAELDGMQAVLAFLNGCGALVEDGVEMSDLNGDGVDELVVVYQNPSEDQIFDEGDLVIFNSTDAGYVLAYRARAAGKVRLLTVEDINLDELPDVAWVDTTCGASTCFDTVNVRSWDGTTWADWTDGTITMAYAEISLSDVSETGLGEEIALEGGIYGSVGAGPQRSRSEVWASIEGGPYSLIEKAYSATECLYHTVLDANRAFLDAPLNGFDAAIAFYTQAVEDEGLLNCWVRNDELSELRSFSLFRLAVIAGYEGDEEGAAAQIAELSAQYPGSVYEEVGQLWLESYEAGGDAAMACEDVTAFAEQDSASWEMLADYGYTNPSFEAVDVCPILDLSMSGEEATEEEATE